MTTDVRCYEIDFWPCYPRKTQPCELCCGRQIQHAFRFADAWFSVPGTHLRECLEICTTCAERGEDYCTERVHRVAAALKPDQLPRLLYDAIQRELAAAPTVAPDGSPLGTNP